jgi:peptidoglycan/xylan/chitin deacetylase (PgdA/CDA1 family)
MQLMSWSELGALPASISLGAHTATHPDLTALSDQQVLGELRQSRQEIEQNTGRAVTTFAYPYGALDRRTAAIVRREFAVACGTRLDFIEAGADVADLPRLDTYYLRSERWFGHLFHFPTGMYVRLRRFARELRRRPA